jgi:hypothetical protein
MIWQEAERERLGVEAETIRLETLRHRSLEQLGRVYGHLESVLDEVRAGIGRVEEEQEDLDEATAAAAARLGVELPASSPEESPRFPDLRHEDTTDAPDTGDSGDPGDLSDLGDAGDGMLSATRPGTAEPSRPAAADRPEQPVLTDPVDDSADGPTPGDAEATQPVLASATAETTQPTPADNPTATTQPSPPTSEASANGEAGPADQDATQRLEPAGNNTRSRTGKPAAKEGKPRP